MISLLEPKELKGHVTMYIVLLDRTVRLQKCKAAQSTLVLGYREANPIIICDAVVAGIGPVPAD
jgi:hypothetical protein